MSSGKNNNLIFAIIGFVVVVVGVIVVFGLMKGDTPTDRSTRPTGTEVVDRPDTRQTPPVTTPRETPIVDRTPVPIKGPRAPLTVTVIDEGSRDPIPNTTVWLQQGSNRAAAGETDAQGIIAFEDIDPGDYALLAKWGPGPEHAGGNVAIKTGETLQRIIEYPARTRFSFRFLMEETQQPAIGREITINLPDTSALLPAPGLEIKGTTDAAGRLRFWAYPDLRPIYFSMNGLAQFTRERENRWLNPYDYKAPLGFEDEGVLRIRENVVQAVGRLVNAPAGPSGQGFVVNAQSGNVLYRALPIVDNQFQFIGETGATFDVSLVRPGPNYTPHEGEEIPGILHSVMNNSVEKRLQVTLPESSGIYNFDIEFDDRLRVRGRVLDAEGQPAVGRLVRANGFGGTNPGREVMGTITGRPMFDFLSEPTDGTGQFSIDLPKAEAYVFMISTLNPIEDAKRMDNVTMRWNQLEAGEEVILRMMRPAIMWGYVVDENDQPVARAPVNLRGAGLPPAWERFGTATDEEGFFMMQLPDEDILRSEGVALGDIYVTAFRQHVGRGMAPVAVNDPEHPVKITMYGTTMVRIRAFNGGEPVERLNVSFLFDAPEFATEIYGGGTRTLTGRRGLFQLQNVPKAITTLAVSDNDNPDGRIFEIPIPGNAKFPHEVRIDFKNP